MKKIKILKSASKKRIGFKLSDSVFTFTDVIEKDYIKTAIAWAQKYDSSAKFTEDNKFVLISAEKLLVWANEIKNANYDILED